MPFVLDDWVAAAVVACDPSDEAASVGRLKCLLEATSAAEVRAAIPNEGDDEVLLHQSAVATVYIVRVPLGVGYPPHDHGMAAVIKVFEGIEVNHYYEAGRADSAIALCSSDRVAEGEVRALAADVVHSLGAMGPARSQALHVYLGDLGAQPRTVFDLSSGQRLPFTEVNYFGLAAAASATALTDVAGMPDPPK